MKKERYTLVDGTPSEIITADTGMKLVRKSDSISFGQIMYLGYRYRGLDGNLLKTPELEKADDYDEVQMTEEELAELEQNDIDYEHSN